MSTEQKTQQFGSPILRAGLLGYPTYVAWNDDLKPEKYILLVSLGMELLGLIGKTEVGPADSPSQVDRDGGVLKGLTGGLANISVLETASMAGLGYCAYSFYTEHNDTASAICCGLAALFQFMNAPRSNSFAPFQI